MNSSQFVPVSCRIAGAIARSLRLTRLALHQGGKGRGDTVVRSTAVDLVPLMLGVPSLLHFVVFHSFSVRCHRARLWRPLGVLCVISAVVSH